MWRFYFLFIEFISDHLLIQIMHIYKGYKGLWPWSKYRHNRIFSETCLSRKYTVERRPIQVWRFACRLYLFRHVKERFKWNFVIIMLHIKSPRLSTSSFFLKTEPFTYWNILLFLKETFSKKVFTLFAYVFGGYSQFFLLFSFSSSITYLNIITFK